MTGPSPDEGRFTALVLAGDRGPEDPLCRAAGVTHKCLVEVGGEPMVARVVAALAASPWIGRIALSLNDPALAAQIPGFQALIDQRRLTALATAESPSRSVLAALEGLDDPFPLLIATADHALLSPAMVDHICAASAGADLDLAVGVTGSALLLRRYPQSKRTYLSFRDERYSGSNLFTLMTPTATAAVDLWKRAEQQRKRPWRIAAVFGPALLLNYLLRRLTLDQALARISQRLGLTVAAVKMPFAEAAIDVDKPEDLALVEEILAREAGSGGPG
ncbi:NTP transferase domain-containing protein [Pelagibius sp.]|uniref:NTP transferase domain-containing protein n=1 Tax=Pelagibius sp. TaxID=1931238 RepID=UPI0026062F4B|nr:NTP transferase domain-containing protein [Pelagibius sp.]